MTSESTLIERIRAIFAAHGVRGEDEDGDAWRLESLLASHVTTDMVVEGVDFDRALYPVRFAGHRALAQNLSDLYAVDAEPVAFVWSLAIPRSWSADDVAAFAEGAARLAAAASCPLLGGDVSSTRSPGDPLVCSISAFGRTPGVPLKRSGARPGQSVWSTKKLGASAAGLRVLQRDRPGDVEAVFAGWRHRLQDTEKATVLAHIEPSPFHTLESLADHAVASIDISDGLVKDVGRLARAAGVRIDLDVQDAVAVGATVDDALYGGEDWAVVFCVPDGLGDPPGCVRVGRVVAGAGVFIDGAAVAERGFSHDFG